MIRKEWELSAGAIWGQSPLNARVRIANVIKHSPMNGIDSEENGRLIAEAPNLLKALERLLNCPDLNLEELNPKTLKAIDDGNHAIYKVTGIIKADYYDKKEG